MLHIRGEFAQIAFLTRRNDRLAAYPTALNLTLRTRRGAIDGRPAPLASGHAGFSQEHQTHMLRTTSKNRASRPAPRAITLVEMLISMAVTLIMMAAVVNLFANIGAGVKKRNASMELGGQLRMARSRLFKDLAGATSSARPKLPSDDHDDGYLEIIEGQWSDKNPSALIDGVAANGELDYATSIVPSSNLKPAGDVTDGGGLGDYDDILALTVRSESEPFVGRRVTWNGARWIVSTIESDLAEIIWFAVENPADGSNGEPGMRTVYRRVLLIAPWVEELPPYVRTSPPGDPDNKIELDQICHQLSDISFRREGDLRVPNTLADLTKRENRFGHERFFGSFPHELELNAIRNNPATPRNNFPEDNGTSRPVMQPFGLPFEWDPSDAINTATQIPTIPPGETFPPGEVTRGDDRKGEDVMLNDVLAFDLRVYDAEAQIVEVAGITTEPSDAGWRYQPVKFPVVGRGAYVDINYWSQYDIYINAIGAIGSDATQVTNNPPAIHPEPTFFSGVASPKSQLATALSTVYDTWPYHYESDGINQDEDYINNNPIPANENIDEGTNGLDDPDPTIFGDPKQVNLPQDFALHGVDDPNERETAPPYDVPLRGLQVKLRIYDRDSRQIREATVTRNFVPQ